MATSASELHPTKSVVHMPRPRPLGSLTASATRITSDKISRSKGFSSQEGWQEDAWEMFDLVGEERFLATTLAGRLAQARLYVGRLPDDPIETPEPLDNDEDVAARAFGFFGSGPYARAQMITRLAINLFVAGDGWLVGIPRYLLPENRDNEEVQERRPQDTGDTDAAMLSLEDLDWRMMSVSEVKPDRTGGTISLIFGPEDSDKVKTTPEDIFLIRVWRSHPRYWWKADSPTKASLPVLRELVGLTMHISAQVDSRLAGAGVLLVPQSASDAIKAQAGLPVESTDDPFTESLIRAMITPISDRSSASAVVPLVLTVPDDTVDKFKHISFSSNLDTEARNLREEAIRRLALGQDAPPELLLGQAGMNHWGAWLVREDVVTTHLEPPLALICDAITSQFLWPVLEAQGMDADEARQYVVWYDVSHMVQRPNRLADALNLHEKGVLKDETLRDAGGFGEEDAPDKNSRSVEIAVQMATANPALVDNMAEIVAAFDAIFAGTAPEELPAPPEADVDTPEPAAEGQGPPATMPSNTENPEAEQ